jgi:hypothetical protein
VVGGSLPRMQTRQGLGMQLDALDEMHILKAWEGLFAGFGVCWMLVGTYGGSAGWRRVG